jgi:hypothetical protein
VAINDSTAIPSLKLRQTVIGEDERANLKAGGFFGKLRIKNGKVSFSDMAVRE